MTLKVVKHPNEFDILWETVIVSGDSQNEVQLEVSRIMDESGNAKFINPIYHKGENRWMSVGYVLKPH